MELKKFDNFVSETQHIINEKNKCKSKVKKTNEELLYEEEELRMLNEAWGDTFGKLFGNLGGVFKEFTKNLFNMETLNNIKNDLAKTLKISAAEAGKTLLSATDQEKLFGATFVKAKIEELSKKEEARDKVIHDIIKDLISAIDKMDISNEEKRKLIDFINRIYKTLNEQPIAIENPKHTHDFSI